MRIQGITIEVSDLAASFELDDVESLWARMKDSAEVAEPRAPRPLARSSSS
jgi:hypothetical protein